jgi:hypothetical protein
VLLVFSAAVIVSIVFIARAVIGPLEATDDYFTLLRQERYAEAYDARCERFRNQLTEEEFVQRETVNGPVGDFDFNDNEFDTDGDDATTSGDVERSGFKYDVTVRLEKEDGDWKVCTIEAERQTG